MTHDERDQLIQRYYDGETIGNEARLAEELLADDPEARRMLDELREMSDAIRVQVADAVEREDFSSYWTEIADRLPKGPLTLETGEPDASRLVVREVELAPRRRPWLQWMFGPGLAAAGVAAVLMALFLPGLFGGGEPAQAIAENVDHTVDIESIDSDADLVIVMQEDADTPAIIWITESEES